MRKHLYIDEEPVRDDHDAGEDDAAATGGLPNRLLTAFEVAEFIGCHEETVRRAYSRGLLTSQRFGVRGRRFHPGRRARLDQARRTDSRLVNQLQRSHP